MSFFMIFTCVLFAFLDGFRLLNYRRLLLHGKGRFVEPPLRDSKKIRQSTIGGVVCISSWTSEKRCVCASTLDAPYNPGDPPGIVDSFRVPNRAYIEYG